VNDVRQIKDEVLFPPNSGKYKVYIIDEVHMLSNSAFNALLKTIEEPPPYIIFIFATTELHKVPATIKSRCQQFAFKSIHIETIQGLLRDACAEMEIEAEDEALFWIAREATGSMRDAYTLFDQIVSFSGGHIRAALIKEKLGLVGFDELNAIAELCARNDTAGAFEKIDAILENGIAIEQFVIDLAGYYRSLLLIKSGITRESLLGYASDRFAKVWEVLSLAQLEQALSVLLELYRNIRYSLSPRFELETALSKLCWLDKWVSPVELRSAVEAARLALGGKPVSAGAVGSGTSGFGAAGSVGTPVSERGAKDDENSKRQDEAPAPDNAVSGATAEANTGNFTEGFKKFLAERSEQKTETEVDDEAETVRRIFQGTYVRQEGN
jgi:DNA polymerase-3 subunit gamma/tau